MRSVRSGWRADPRNLADRQTPRALVILGSLLGEACIGNSDSLTAYLDRDDVVESEG